MCRVRNYPHGPPHDRAQRQEEIRRAKQLELPVVAGSRIPIPYLRIDGTGVPETIAETQRRRGKRTRPTRPYAWSQVHSTTRTQRINPVSGASGDPAFQLNGSSRNSAIVPFQSG
jgi:hypothetical protein